MTDKNPREEKIRAFYNKPTAHHTYLEKRFGVNLRTEITKKLLGEVTDSRILDIGCGDGTISLQYALNNNQLTFIDLSDKMLALAKKNTPKYLVPNFKYLNLDFFDYLPDQPFNIVLCIGVLAHLQSLDTALNKLSSLLKPGGLCVIQFTDNDKWIAKIDSIYYLLNKIVYRDLHNYSLLKSSYQEVLHSCLQNNFEIVRQFRYSFLFPGMGRFPDKFLYRYQLLTLENKWLSKLGSEVIILLVKS